MMKDDVSLPTVVAPARGWPLPDARPSPVSLEQVAALLKGLDPDQRRAVRHGEGPLLVLAGPGTGKTRVITRRIAWLIATKRARPAEILALTFTDKAAEEMQARVDELVPYGYADTTILTFHAFGDRLLREFALELGLPTDLRVLSRPEAVIFLRERLFELGLDRFRPLGDPTRFLRALVDLFSRAKDEDVSPATYAEHAAGLGEAAHLAAACGAADAAELGEQAARQRELAHAYGRYQELLAAAGCLDFGDQVTTALRLLRDHPAVRGQLARRYRHVLVDEFQDTNPAQLALLEQLADGHPNITVVGDDDQAVYTFRGAATANLVRFRERFPTARQVVLRRNYRSRAPILGAARRLIGHNGPGACAAGVPERKLLTRRRTHRPAPVIARWFETVSDEADWVAETIAARVSRGARPSDFAVLVRANAHADPFLRSLNVQRLPWRFSGASGLYARPEVRELRAFLRVVADLGSTVDLYALAAGEPYGLGGTDLTEILQFARRRHRSLWSVCEELLTQPGLIRVGQGTRRALARLVDDLRAACELAHNRPAGEVLYDHLKRSGRLARLAAAPDGDGALLNVARFFELVRAQSRVLPDDRVPFLAAHLQTLIEAGDDPATVELDGADAVAVLTVHKAKGLEFPVVFVIGLADGRFPSRARRDPLALPDELRRGRGHVAPEEQALDEERRLCYVAVTRAREELFLTGACEGSGRGRRRPSPFMAEALDRPLEQVAAGVAAGRSAMQQLLEEPPIEGPPAVVAALPPGDERLSLSFSQLDEYLTCPLKFRFSHVLRVPQPPHHALVYGTALHQAVAAFHTRQIQGRPMSEDELLEVFAAHWSSEGFLSREHEDARFSAGRQTLRRFRSEQLASNSIPVAVEQEFAFTLDGDRLRGRVDRIDGSGDGVVITDYKSGDVRDPKKAREKARDSLQLALYALAHEARTGTAPAAVQLHFLDSGVVGQVAADPARLERARGKIRQAADGMRRRDFGPRPDYVGCSYCPYRDICPSSAA